MGDSVPGRHGALVVSLDFELYWGVLDHYPADGGDYRDNLTGSRSAVPKILELFSRYDIAATWAIVGLMTVASRRELAPFLPALKPAYRNPSLSPYPELEALPEDDADPIRFGRDLVELIRAAPRQEIGSHTFSHYYCLEDGQTKETFEADIRSAVAVADAQGLPPIRSLVFPRNQFNPAYADVLKSAGIDCCRTNPRGWFHREMAGDQFFSRRVRLSRLVDSYLPLSGRQTIARSELGSVDGVLCIPASHFLRPFTPRLKHLEPLRLRRIVRALDAAASAGEIFHLWWHPENFGQHQAENLAFLERVLEAFGERRERLGMRSLAMGDVADHWASSPPSAGIAPTPERRPSAPSTTPDRPEPHRRARDEVDGSSRRAILDGLDVPSAGPVPPGYLGGLSPDARREDAQGAGLSR